MIIKVLGILDIFIGICFVSFFYLNFPPASFISILGVILLIKGGIFSISPNLASAIDICCAFVIIGSAHAELPIILVNLITLYLITTLFFLLCIH